MKIGVIGSNGFLGSHIVRAVLKNKYSLEQISFRYIKNETLLKLFKQNFQKLYSCDYIINCCAVKYPQNKYDKFINSKLPIIIQNHIYRKKLKCKFIHISTFNIFFEFLDDDYTVQKKIADDSLNRQKTYLIIRPSLIWDENGNGDSMILKKFLEIPLPFYFMINSGNLYRPIKPKVLAEFIMNNIEISRSPNELNVLGDKILSLYQLFREMASQTKKKTIPINSIFLCWLKLLPVKKSGAIKTISQQICNFDRTGDNLRIKNRVFLKFNF